MKPCHLLIKLSTLLLTIFIYTNSLAAATKLATHWSGLYFGVVAGGISSDFDTNTFTQASATFSAAQANAINNAGALQINTGSFLAGVEGGYDWQLNHFLIGLETDIQSLSTNGAKDSGAVIYPTVADRQFVVTAYNNNNWLFTFRPRLGLVANNWLFYVTGGLALTYLQGDYVFSREVISTGAVDLFESKRVNTIKPGYVVGAGIETALTSNISLKLGYQFQHYSTTKATAESSSNTAGNEISSSVGLTENIIKVGLNYFFDNQFTNPLFNSNLFNLSNWAFQLGTRVFVSSGLDGAPQPLLNRGPRGNTLASRLTFSRLLAVSAETFGKLEYTNGLFLKGYLGAGTITSGQLNDEDFPAGGAYSNTLSDTTGNLSYVTADLGYAFLKSSFAQFGVFVGYNYFEQNLNAYSCEQLAGASVCVPSSLLKNFLGITEDDYFNSMRIGLSTQFNLTNRLSLVSEAAFIPLVHFTGRDIHDARELIGPESSENGDGAMLEAVLRYQLSHSWSIGIGGRYWMWNMHDGNIIFDLLGQNGTITIPGRFTTYRYGAFVQLSYFYKKYFDDHLFAQPVNWQGVYLGVNLGGSWGRSEWTDPFGSTRANTGFNNAAKFGDYIKSTGPLGGVNLKIDWQKGQCVYGIGGMFDGADIRGENTVFSGIGGINAMMITHYFATMVGRVGIALNRSLLYLDSGAAVVNTSYKLNGNTTALSLGTGTDTLTNWGWTIGAGIEYALADHWASTVAYSYIGIPSDTVSFPSVATINQQHLSVSQGFSAFQLGLDYKF